MKMVGHCVCMFFYGMVFVGISLSAAGLFLSIEEVRASKRTEFLQSLSLGLFSPGSFIFSRAEVVVVFAGLWLLGDLIGGVAATEAMWQMKRLRFSEYHTIRLAK